MKAWRISIIIATVLVMVIALAGCSGSSKPAKVTYRVPPRIDLSDHEMIGVVEFRTDEDGELGSLATRRFTESAREDQGLVRMIGFGSEKDAARSVGKSVLDTEAYKALGDERGVRTIVVGELTVSEIRPDVRISGALDGGSVSAKVDVTLAVQMIEAATGASIWSRSARATRSVGHVGMYKGGQFVFDAEDPEAAYGELVNGLVSEVTRDFHATYVRR